MQSVTLVLFLLLLVVVTRVAARVLPAVVPLPLVQIVFGTALAYGFGLHIEMEPELFFVVFIAPLLFLDGWRIPKNALIEDWRPIVTLALGLVVFTVVGVGYLVDAMIPAIPLAVAFAVGAVLSPTDPVSVSAIAGNAPIPARLMHILEGEALFNDASGLVCLRFAVLAAITGSFSPWAASWMFFQLAAGGLLVGVAVAWIASAAYYGLNRWLGEDTSSSILVSLLIPFAAYLAAEHLHCSGVLAAAAAGISMHYTDLVGMSTSVTRMRRSAIWETLQDGLNGIIFILLGLQLPAIIDRMPTVTRELGVPHAGWLALYVATIAGSLVALRFVWVLSSLWLSHWRVRRRGQSHERPRLRFVLVASLAGVKGAVTLAAVLTLPVELAGGQPFPARDAVIALATGVILVSLVVAAIGLPLLARNLETPQELTAADDERSARDRAAEAAIARIEQLRGSHADTASDLQHDIAARVIEGYRKRLDFGQKPRSEGDSLHAAAATERRLRLAGLDAERRALNRLRLAHQIDDVLHRRLVHEIDLAEASLRIS